MAHHASTRFNTPRHATTALLLLLLTYGAGAAEEDDEAPIPPAPRPLPPVPPGQACGRQQARGRVVGGSGALPGQWPWLVSLQLGGQHRCGGTLLTPRWVLSAAHCFQGPADAGSPAAWRAVLGRVLLSAPGGQDRAVARVLLHPRYRRVQGGHDLALVELHPPARLGPGVGTLCLPHREHPLPYGAQCWVAGWGHIAENVSLPRAAPLQQVPLELLSADTCNCLYSSLRRRALASPARPGMLCAGGAAGRGACQADSGGPVQCRAPSGRWVQAAVLSFAVGCARPNVPVLGTALGAHERWLRRHLPPSAFIAPHSGAADTHSEEGKCLGCGMWGGPALAPPGGAAWPWSVALLRGGQPRCGGALIAESWVLSAAHCFIGHQDPAEWEALPLSLATPPSDAADDASLSRHNGTLSRHNVTRLHLHGAYVGPGRGQDVALLRLDPALVLSAGLRPLCVPYGDHRAPAGTRCWALMGAYDSASPTDVLSVEVSPPEPCGSSTPSDTVCVTVLEGNSTPQALGGSPLACLERGIWFLLGTATTTAAGGGGRARFTSAPPLERWVTSLTREAYFTETPPDRGGGGEEEEDYGDEDDGDEPIVSMGGTNTTEEPGALRDPHGQGDPETLRDPHGQGDPKAIEDPEAMEDPKTMEDPKAMEDPKTIEDPKTTEDPGALRDPHGQGDPEAMEDPKTVEDPEALRDPHGQGEPKTTEDPETIEDPHVQGDPKAIEDPKTIGDPEALRDPHGQGDPKAIEDPKTIEDPHDQGDPKAMEDPEALRDLHGQGEPHGQGDPKTTEDPKTRGDPRSRVGPGQA